MKETKPKVTFLNEGDRYLDKIRRQDYKALMITGIPIDGDPMMNYSLQPSWEVKDLMAAIGMLEYMKLQLLDIAMSAEGDEE